MNDSENVQVVDVKKQRYIEARLAGKTQEEAGLYAGSKTIEGARKYASRMSKDVQVQNSLNNVLDVQLLKHNITLDRMLKNISDALDATKQNNFTGEITADHSTRLKATTMALDLLPKTPPQEKPNLTKEDITKLASDSNEIELQKAIFRK